MDKSTWLTRVGLAQMLKGGVIMDVVTPEQARIAEEAGACAVMALERVPADIRAQGGVSRMSDPEMIQQIIVKLLKELPVAMLIGIRKSRLRCSPTQTEMVQVAAGHLHAVADVANGINLPEMTEKHAYQMVPAVNTFRKLISGIFPHCLLKKIARNYL